MVRRVEVQGLSCTVLAWARERAGLTIDQVAHRLKKTPADVDAWESGHRAPTYVELEKLAYDLYRRPIAIFFFPGPPDEPEPKGEFRLIPDAEIEAFGVDALFAVRQARARQESLRELSGGSNPAGEGILRQIQAKRFSSLASLCDRVRKTLGVDLETQTTWRSLDRGFKEWRQAIEAAGVFVFKRPFDQDEISGFCLFDLEFPIIYVNNSTPLSRQVFTLFHELAHLLYRSSGVTKEGPSYLEALAVDERAIEMRCNAFAGAFLVPDRDFNRRISGIRGTDNEVEDLAAHYSVSRETILRKLLDRAVVDQPYYERKRRQYRDEWRIARAASKGGDYYRNQISYLSGTYTRLAFNGYYEGRWSIEQLGEYLGIRAKNVETFETYLAPD